MPLRARFIALQTHGHLVSLGIPESPALDRPGAPPGAVVIFATLLTGTHGGTTISFEVSALFNHKPPIHNVSFDVARSAQHDLVSPDAPLQVTA
jgi:hypothetical protein